VEQVEHRAILSSLGLEQGFSWISENAAPELAGRRREFFGGTKRNKVEQLNWRGFLQARGRIVGMARDSTRF
jgi:hypothetical protein